MTPPERLRHDVLVEENRRLRRAVEELAILKDLALEIGGSTESDTVMRTVIGRSIRAIGAEQGDITLVDEDRQDPARTLVRSMVTSAGRSPVHLDQNLLGWMQLNRRPILVNDPRTDPRFRYVQWDRTVRSLLAVPLMVKAKLIGLLTIYNKKAEGGFSEEDQRLLSIIAGQSAQMIDNARLREEEQELLRMQEELRLACRIQEHLLPSDSPEIAGYDVAGRSVPAQAVGGDYFDYIETGDGEWGICVGDVSGKGLPAALVMANLQATLRAQAMWSSSVAQCVERTNMLLCHNTRRGTFVTLFYGQLNTQTHRFTWANAGHNRPYVLPAAGGITSLKEGDIILGFRPEHAYTARSIVLEPGDAVVIYSDGVTECMNEARVEFGEERFRELLLRCAHLPPGELIERTLDALKEHAAGMAASDDITMAVLRRTA